MAIINGTNLRDIINGTSLADQIFGNGGDDTLRGNAGNDAVRGGEGNDVLEGGAGDDLLFADGGSSNSLFGGDGSDILVSGTGSDLMNGGTGIDAASWEESPSSGVEASLATGQATSAGVEDTITHVENLIGSRFSDTLIGDRSANELFGGAGNDVLRGGDGGDRLFGGSGNDFLDGGAGTNLLRGDSGIDTVTFTGATFVNVDLGRNTALSSLGTYSLSGIESVEATSGDDVVTGSGAANIIAAREGEDAIDGGKGADVIFGQSGADAIDGGEGNDELYGGSGSDAFIFKASDRAIGGFGSQPFDAGFDRIADFETGDRIDLTRHFEATTFQALKAEASQFGADTHLRLGEDTVVLEEMALTELTASMFLF